MSARVMTSATDAHGNELGMEMIAPLSTTMHVSSNRRRHGSPGTRAARDCSAARCVYEGCLLLAEQLSLLTSVNMLAVYPGVF